MIIVKINISNFILVIFNIIKYYYNFSDLAIINKNLLFILKLYLLL